MITDSGVVVLISGDTSPCCKLKVAACEVQQYETNVI